MRNRPFDAVLLRWDRRSLEVPTGWLAWEYHESVLRVVICAGWPDQEPGWTAFLEGDAVLRVTDAEANVRLTRALRAALMHWRYRPRNPPLPQSMPPQKQRRQ